MVLIYHPKYKGSVSYHVLNNCDANLKGSVSYHVLNNCDANLNDRFNLVFYLHRF